VNVSSVASHERHDDEPGLAGRRPRPSGTSHLKGYLWHSNRHLADGRGGARVGSGTLPSALPL